MTRGSTTQAQSSINRTLALRSTESAWVERGIAPRIASVDTHAPAGRLTVSTGRPTVLVVRDMPDSLTVPLR